MQISVVIPVLNEEKYLPIILESFSKQTDKEFEVIVADTHSEDKTLEKADEFKDKINLRIVQVDRKNVAHQRNAGGKEAKGDAVVFLDADYTVKKDFIENAKKIFSNEKIDLIIPFSYPITNNPLWTFYFYIQNYICQLSGFLGRPFGVASAAVIRKQAFEKNKYNEEVYVFEDQYFFKTAKNNGLTIKYAHNLNTHFSLRRLEEDGVWGYFYFNLYATFYYIFKGPIYKKFYNYRMGGGVKNKK